MNDENAPPRRATVMRYGSKVALFALPPKKRIPVKITKADAFAWYLQRNLRWFIGAGAAMLILVGYLTGEWSPLP